MTNNGSDNEGISDEFACIQMMDICVDEARQLKRSKTS